MECLWSLFSCRIFLIISFGLGPLQAAAKCIYPEDIFGTQVEIWNRADSSNNIPSNVTLIASLEVPVSQHVQTFRQRLRAYFHAPETGIYVFYLSCKDVCELRVSVNERLKNLETVITVHHYTGFREWKSTFSKKKRLSKGHYYLLDVSCLHFEGAYHLSVGVKLPNGSYSRPIGTEFLVKYAPPGSFGDAPIRDWGQWSKCSKSCGIGTQSRNRSLCTDLPPVYQQRNETEMRVCQPVRPCLVPISGIVVYNISSTSLLVKWKYERQILWPNEQRSFNITFNRTVNETKETLTANASLESLELRDLEAFTWYCVKVQLVTVGGVGRESPCVFARTDQDVPCSSPTGLLAHAQLSPSKIRAKWRALPDWCWRGTPRGYSILVKVNDTVHMENKTGSGNYTVGPLSTGFRLEGLSIHTRYSLRVAALTDKGPGPYSDAIQIETCRCPHKFFVNWVQAPPLIMNLNNSVNESRTSPTGLLPALLPDMIADSCGVCHAHKRTVIIFTKEKASIHKMTSSLNDHSQLNLPISMAPNVPFVREGWVFLPVVEVAGVAVLMRKPNTGAYAGQLGSSILLLWPIICVMLALYFALGLAVWILEKYENPDQFSPRLPKGWSEGIWWVFVSMTTIGYGDRYPISVPGRLLAICIILTGIIINALFISAMASSLTVFVSDETANPERGSKIGVVKGNVEHSLGMRINGSKGVTSIPFSTKDSLLQGLKSRTLDGALIDVLTVDPFIKALNNSNFQVAKIIPKKFYFGITLTGEAKYLAKYFEKYIKSISIESLAEQRPVTIQEKSSPQDDKPSESSHEDVIPFMDPGTELFKRALMISGFGLVVCVICGLIYHFAKASLKCRQDKPRDPNEKLIALRAEMREILDEFHKRVQKRYCALKIKQRKQLLKLTRSAQAKSNMGL
ncbi:uncharacterized protein LOC141892721 isoform X1 [Acropora palmata]|uniref:uncharacterized protein LOC141892721 isoform X1 n=1 Tax=Acropora palmata TaxID=6131 RepID=UPI003DA0F636